MIKGKCECSGVAFEVPSVRDTVTFCHCRQCARFSGHVWAATHAPLSAVTFTADETLTWFSSSDWAERGFCNRCGSSLFYRMTGADDLGIAAGCLIETTGLQAGKHIFVKDKASYYEIAADAPQIQKY